MKRRDLLAAGIAAATLPIGAPAAGRQTLRLGNARWSVVIDPSTLAIAATPAGAATVTVSRSSGPHDVTELKTDGTFAIWRRDGFAFACELDGPDLHIGVTAGGPSTLALLDQPGTATGKGLILPISEGYYVAADDAGWRAALDGEDRSTNEDLGVPLWGMDHGAFTLHWLMANPYNNKLVFKAEAGGIALSLVHEFTRIAPETPMEMALHLGGPDLLAGAKRYRRHLIDRGEFRSLAEKIKATPSAEKLIGATHLYLWDNGLIGVKDVRDWPGLIARMRDGSGLAEGLRGRYEKETLDLLRTAPAKPDAWQQRAIVNALNAALTDHARLSWQKEEVDPDTLVATYRALRAEAETAFGPVLRPDPASWGSSLTPGFFNALKLARLDRLWIGLGDGWEGGLWRPEAIRGAVSNGYLIGPYDSYETAIPPGERPDWATAQLGRRAYEQCGVMKANGTITAGFQRTGHYTNTNCVMPILKGRVPALAKAGGYNSWFLDVYATGMVFDDYRPGATLTMAGNSAANIAAMRWISEDQQLPIGSEGGNAINASGTLFAHGMETAGFGWGDAELRKDAKSPFFLGGWYPADAPTVFFKPVPLKEPYRSLYFDPRTRLPLYQAVFHDAVLVTQHWAFDQLKLNNLTASRAITQQLYNVPPLFHLSAGTLRERLPAIRKHDGFFRPLHQRLAHQAMTGFDWLSADRLVQRTTFADGTQLIANFADAPRVHDGLGLLPRSVTAIVDGKPGQVFEA